MTSSTRTGGYDGPPERLFVFPGPPRLEIVRRAVQVGHRRWQHHWLVEQGGLRGVVVIPTHIGRILLVRQWRPAIDRSQWELPRGFAEREDLAAEAVRELAEETGIATTTPRPLGTIYPDSGVIANGVAVYRVEVDAQQVALASAGEEVSDARWFDPAETAEMTRRGDLTDGITLAALALGHAHEPLLHPTPSVPAQRRTLPSDQVRPPQTPRRDR